MPNLYTALIIKLKSRGRSNQNDAEIPKLYIELAMIIPINDITVSERKTDTIRNKLKQKQLFS